MSEQAKHTKGPWVGTDAGDNGILIHDAGRRFGICRVIGESGAPLKANAALILASPDLLAAAEAVIAEEDDTHRRAALYDMPGWPKSSAVAKLREIVAKARGT